MTKHDAERTLRDCKPIHDWKQAAACRKRKRNPLMEHFLTTYLNIPAVAVFIIIAGGHILGKLKVGKFQLGGFCGILIVAILVGGLCKWYYSISSVRYFNTANLDSLRKIGFLLFIYAVGYEVGPSFLAAFRRRAWKEVHVALFLSLVTVGLIVLTILLTSPTPGALVGSVAGGLTQASILGTGESQYQLMGGPDFDLFIRQETLAFASTYAASVIITMLFCVVAVPYLLKRSLEEDAFKLQSASGGRLVEAAEEFALPKRIGRMYRVARAQDRTVEEFNASVDFNASIEAVYRDMKALEGITGTVPAEGDVVVIIGKRQDVIALGELFGEEVRDCSCDDLVMQSMSGVITRRDCQGITLAEFRSRLAAEAVPGIYIEEISRGNRPLPLLADTLLHRGDVVRMFDRRCDIRKAAGWFGYLIDSGNKTDMLALAVGIASGVGLGLLPLFHPSLKLGDCLGVMFLGILISVIRSRHPFLGAFPPAASQLFKDFGLSLFLVITGLSALDNLHMADGRLLLSALAVGAVFAIVPLTLTALFAKYVLKYDNSAVLASSLAGARSANPAFAAILEKSGASCLAVPFSVTYAVSNVSLTLLGPLTIYLFQLFNGSL